MLLLLASKGSKLVTPVRKLSWVWHTVLDRIALPVKDQTRSLEMLLDLVLLLDDQVLAMARSSFAK